VYAQESTVTLDIPEIIQILSIDGKEQNSTFFGSRDRKQQLTAGEHVLSVRYSQLFNLTADEHDIIKSKPLALRFVAETGKNYQLIADAPKRYEAAKEFAKNPTIRLVDKTTGNSQSAVLIKSYAEASLVDTIGKAFQNASDENQAATSNSNNAQLLQELWLKATPQERQAFAAWLAAQAAK
jgi:hypothetical protein